MDKKQFIKKYGTKWHETFSYFFQLGMREKLEEIISDDKLELKLMESGEIFIINETGNILMSNRQSLINQSIN